MKVLLVRPISDTYIVTPPIGLGYVATAIRKAGLRPEILDCAKEKTNFDGFRKFIMDFKPDVVGFQVWSCDVPNVEKSLRIVKEINPRIITLIGGAHPSGVPLDAMEQFKDADFGFKGEAEVGVELLTRNFLGGAVKLEEIPGLIWRQENKVRVNHSIFVEDLDSLGFPAWDLMPPDTYPNAPHQGFAMRFPTAPIVITRGCPFNCTFCATHSINERKIRSRSVGHVIDEIKLLRDTYKVGEIHIEDDNFTFKRDFVRDFCQRLESDKIDIYWYCSSGIRIDSLDKDTINLMKKTGCYTLTVAIESGSQRVLNLMNKSLTLEKVKKGVQLMNECGFKPTGLFMIGFPGETKAEINETIEFAKSLNLKRAQFAIFHPMPGSEIFDELKKRGELENLDWSKIKPSETAYSSVEASKKELKKLQRDAFLKFYMRPRIMWYQLREVRSVGHAWFLFKRVLSMLF